MEDHVAGSTVADGLEFWVISNVTFMFGSHHLALFGDQHLLIVPMGDSKSGTFGFHHWVVVVLKVSPRRWIFLHVALHPLGELLLLAEPKPNSLPTIGLETSINEVAGLS